MNTGKWINVSRNNLCSRCQKPDWCQRSDDGCFEICRRLNDGTGKTKTGENGNEYHVYYVGPQTSRSHASYNRTYKKPPKLDEPETMDQAKPEKINEVYVDLLDLVPVNEGNFEKLAKRGLTQAEILRRKYATMSLRGRARIIEELSKKYDLNLLAKVPGFYFNDKRVLKLAAAPGLIVPVRNTVGEITALVVRLDEPIGKTKYVYISSKKKGGIGSGAPAHVPLNDGQNHDKVRLTEGHLKADIATIRSGILTLSIPGVTIQKDILPILKALKVKTVILAMDMDGYTNRHVALALQKIATALKEAGYEVEIETWDGNKAKGIDDALVAGIDIIFHKGLAAFKVINEIVASAIAANPTQQESTLNNARKLIIEAIEKIKSDPSIAFQSDVLRALLLLKTEDFGAWAQFRAAAQKAKILSQDLKQALKKEEHFKEQESQRSSENDKNKNGTGSKGNASNGSGDIFSQYKKYEERDGGIIWNKMLKEEIIPVRLSNFVARIDSQEIIDDGIEKQKVFILSGVSHGGPPFSNTRVSADEFSSMSWVHGAWGATAIPSAGVGIKDHLRAAIQELSGDVPSRISYAHLGWRRIGGKWFYFFNGGAISESGLADGFNVDLGESKLKDYRFSEPPTGEILQFSIRASLSILELAPHNVTYPLLAATYRAITGEILPVNFSIFLYGLTGAGKSELVALLQQHFGKAFIATNLPGNWSSTVNSLELDASIIKDGIFSIDDFSPQPTEQEMKRLYQAAERLLRAQGNRSGRGRVTSEIKSRPERHPRGLILSTGEELPKGVSLRARIFIEELDKKDVDFKKLDILQKYGREGIFAQAMSAYIKWLAPRMDQLKVSLPGLHQQLRQEFSIKGSHKRSPDMTASLALGFGSFLEFAQESGAITPEEVEMHTKNLLSALIEAGDCQTAHQASADPVNQFLELIGSAISSGHCHLCDPKTLMAPKEAERWGWRVEGQVLVGHDSQPSDVFRPKGSQIGWVSYEDNELWLDSEETFAVTQKLARDQNTFIPASKYTLLKQLADRGLILKPEKEKRYTMKRSIKGGARPCVLVFPNKNILLDVATAAPLAPSEDNGT